jgi:ABC-type Mn2+/Zn2+ transport system permease subunit
VSADLARTAGVNVRRLDLAFLVAFALVVAFGLRYLGVLLMGSLIIIPPATARQFARNLTSMLVSSAALALLATLAGTWLALRYHRPTGPFIVVVAVVCFGTALMIPRATFPPRRPASSVS